jgi:steroid 5-alpha reductase family enzyme
MMNCYSLGLALAAAFALAGWLASVAKRDVGVVDSLWSLMFLGLTLMYLYCAPLQAARARLVLVLVAIWALRLALYIAWRNFGKGEDRRYQEIRARNEPNFWLKSLYLVFGLQASLAWLISMPLLAVSAGTAPLGWIDAAALVLWSIGMLFEAGGDWQLSRFKADPNNRGKVMDRGLWRYTRHPNYFGDCCVWWGYYLFALAAGGWWSIAAPLVMTLLLLKVSGVALLEKDIGERRPDYAAYVRRTNTFLPGRPRP